ncbi:atrial natriuretic peptide receptor 1-like [Gigantopelta aegis]|uniref:atrial natriuretic peptide receptor 1-like n=1 Tax=Gigantopelta aegis TaxID=1735272 RepID=UPI001B888BBA|nr:atrial natriuretic peptide receptor 1-like [Gigantopelta aegis]
MDPETGDFQTVAHSFGEEPFYIPYQGRTIHWPGPTQQPPLNVPRCGYLGNFSICQENDIPVYAKVLVGLLAIVIVAIIALILVYRRRRWERELRDMSWQIKLEDLNFQGQMTGSRLSKLSCGWLADETESIMGKSCSSFGPQLNMPGTNQKFTRVATYRGVVVAVKPTHKEKIVFTREVLLELKLMQHLHHENMTEFVGAVVELKNNFIITEYCSKGSLQDVLQNDSIKLDWMFRLSLLRDIVRVTYHILHHILRIHAIPNGMTFLHQSPIKIHGRLRSTNCLVDRKFVLKISGFGLPILCERAPSEEELLTHAHYEKLLWVAPELLNVPVKIRTQKGDIYSLGIILEEVIHRALPYEKSRADMGPKEIIALVGSHLDPPFRPKLDTYQGNVPVGVYSLMYRCWAELPEDRPTFPIVEKIISKLQGNKEVNLVEALIHRLEEYSSNLEYTVEERTQQLLTEKKKSEALLYKILPVTVADQLKQGKHVEPEMFDCVTVYFSDIVGFTKMSSESSPVEVVEFLNDLYTLFDSVIENYNVYKVETIGDAYMCVSGLPIKTEDHAVEICHMALALLRGVKHFSIKHRPDEHLRVRIGIHSGPCAAGVVGLKMPRYCLFGDTVNTSSRMESNGEALKIHISMSTKTLLDKVKLFDTELRGTIEMKGKGAQVTYWLIGERSTNDD